MALLPAHVVAQALWGVGHEVGEAMNSEANDDQGIRAVPHL